MHYTKDKLAKISEAIEKAPTKAEEKLTETAALKKLNKSILNLHELKGYTVKEIAELLKENGFKITQKTIKNLILEKKSMKKTKNKVS